jgi:hypothetical protein
MRFNLFSPVILAALLTSCANEGVVVQKSALPFPFYHSLGMEGKYTFVLRDKAGTMRRQMVTPEVFERYAIGEYFNDLQPVSTQGERFSDDKAVKAAALPSPWRAMARQASTTKTKKARSVAATPRKSRAAVAAKRGKSRQMVAKRALPKTQKSEPIRKEKPVRATPVPDAEIVFISVARCR